MMKILISGFEPFGGSTINPTEQLIRSIQRESIPGVEIRTVLLPVYFDDCVDLLVKEIENFGPDAVISCGLAGGRRDITPERIAVNLKDIAPDAPYPDNKGAKPQDMPINPDGPDGLMTKLPIRKMVNRLKEQGIPASISYTAGTFICNNTMYGILDYIRRKDVPVMAGFVHFPASAEMADEHPDWPTLPQETLLQGLRVIVQTTVDELQHMSKGTP
ncbi:pyroglutamyl-peptidase I [Cohnella pontilimi]|uniref:Pyroglutamyl-peptidase I n=2 Tax=Cohnella pontilimi TaxID=2564100 RepID=A0A4U0FAL4_9BACL|nr:pyroglutamyl-peptidase I [Cohnella pontilimi]